MHYAIMKKKIKGKKKTCDQQGLKGGKHSCQSNSLLGHFDITMNSFTNAGK